MSDYICDDRLDVVKLTEDIRNMTDEEFEKFLKEEEKNEDYPKKYYMC